MVRYDSPNSMALRGAFAGLLAAAALLAGCRVAPAGAVTGRPVRSATIVVMAAATPADAAAGEGSPTPPTPGGTQASAQGAESDAANPANPATEPIAAL